MNRESERWRLLELQQQCGGIDHLQRHVEIQLEPEFKVEVAFAYIEIALNGAVSVVLELLGRIPREQMILMERYDLDVRKI